MSGDQSARSARGEGRFRHKVVMHSYNGCSRVSSVALRRRLIRSHDPRRGPAEHFADNSVQLEIVRPPGDTAVATTPHG